MCSFVFVDKEKVTKALIIEGDSAEVSNAFSLIKKNSPGIKFDVFQYAHNEQDGSGNAIHIDYYGLYQYDYIFISVHEGSLSDNFMERLSAYVLDGGRAFLSYQSYPRPYYVEAMAESSNLMLDYLRINDEIIYDTIAFDSKLNGSLVEVDNATRIVNTSRKAVARLKYTKNTTSSEYDCAFDSGHFFYKNSDLDQAKSILEFNADSLRAPMAAFWTAGKGVIGIATEKYSSAASSKSTGSSWRLIWQKLNMKVQTVVQQNEIVVSNETNAEIVYLTERRLLQIRKQEAINKAKLEAEMKADKDRMEAEFDRYVASEKIKLKEYKFRNKLEQQRLKEELNNIVRELKSSKSDDLASEYNQDENAELEDSNVPYTRKVTAVDNSKAVKANEIQSNRPIVNQQVATKDEKAGYSQSIDKPAVKDKQREDAIVASNDADAIVERKTTEPKIIIKKSKSQTKRKTAQSRTAETVHFKKNVASLSTSTKKTSSKKSPEKVELDESMLSPAQIKIADANDVLNATSRIKIDKKLEMLKSSDPYSTILIESHLNIYEKSMDNFLKSIRTGNKIKKHYVRNGIDPDRIILYGLGDAYKMGDQMIVSEKDSESTDGFKKNVDTRYTSTEYDLYEKKSQGITFRISLGTKPIAWNAKIIDKLGDFSVEQYGNDRIMTGVVGIFKDPYFVQEIIDIIQDWKLPNPELLVYLDGIRLKPDEIKQLSPNYAELQKYLRLVARS